MISSFKNEFVAGIDLNSIELNDDSEIKSSTRLGGVFRAMFDAKVLVSNIVKNQVN